MPELWCEAGEHKWERESQRGRRPRSCPKHSYAGHACADHTPEGERFTEAELAQDRADARAGVQDPTFAELKNSLDRYGPEGVLESARHLSEDQYEQLARLVAKTPAVKTVRPRKR